MTSRRTVTARRRAHGAGRPLLIGIALGLGLVSAPAAHASTYRVYTASAASSMTLNAGDGVCTLAEAVQHASDNPIYNCTDFAPGSSEQRIELLESPNKPYSANHFKITSLTLVRQGIRIRVVGSGSGAFIDSTCPSVNPCSASAFVVPFKSIGFFERVTLTNTAGSRGSRLIENYGELGLNFVTITKGDVSGAQHPSGRGGGIFNGTTQGLFPAVISFAENTVITQNRAKKGGGIYNDSSIINELQATISNNSATLAGGGIYNISNSLDPGRPTNGTIETTGLSVTGNTARTGGGIFNRAWIELLSASTISGNSTTSSGSSGEKCTGSTSCDGMGGGVLNAHISASAADNTPSGSVTRFTLLSSTLSNNTASARGGAVYSVGVLELGGNAINGNRAADGAVIYMTGPTDGMQQYCNTYGASNVGTSTIMNNCVLVNGNCSNATGFFSIVSGSTGGRGDFRGCTFGGLRTPGQTTYMTASGNSTPLCQSAVIDINSRCPPQP